MDFFNTNLPYILAGISTGGQYALIAIGYTMVYGILRLINFAHGDVFMASGLIMVYMYTSMPMYISIPFTIVIPVNIRTNIIIILINNFFMANHLLSL